MGVAGGRPHRRRGRRDPLGDEHRRRARAQPAAHPALAAHAELGDQLLVFAAPLLVCVFALAFLDGRRRHSARGADGGPGTMAAPAATSGRTRVMAVLVAVLTVAFAVVCGVQVFRIGDSGARAAWGDVRYTPQIHAFQQP
jgi:hypothetical protein